VPQVSPSPLLRFFLVEPGEVTTAGLDEVSWESVFGKYPP
jgi:hypothetical protein